jgi:DNA-binding MarR family transcriptional regulator
MRRAIHVDLPGPGLPASERELLILVNQTPGIGVAEAAEVLCVAANTVSTLVGSLRQAGLLQRRADPSDRRAANLHLTEAGETRIREIRRRRSEVLDRTLALIAPEDRKVLLDAVPAIDRLTVLMSETEPGG